MDGIILVDKPKNFTSFDAVNFLKKRFGFKKAGHGGTLDPLATGLLIILIGRATKLAGTFLNDSKTYLAELILGLKTDTFDITGKVIEKKPCLAGPGEIKKAIKSFEGEISQRPPVFSALRHKGQRLYKLARKGKIIVPEKRKVFIHYIKKIKLSAAGCEAGQNFRKISFEVKCSKGTYIRSLCNDIGEVLGCGAVLNNLRRIESGKFHIKNAVSIDTLKKGPFTEKLLVNPVRELRSLTVCADGGIKPPAASIFPPPTSSVAFSNGVNSRFPAPNQPSIPILKNRALRRTR